MALFTIVTGNQHKLEEYRRLLPASIDFDHANIDLDEIQEFDARLIVEHKVKQAYETIGKPVIVEDVSAGLNELNGLPGPFIKFFEKRLGKGALHTLVREDNRATVTCTIGYYDGSVLLLAMGEVQGTVVAARGENGFGFDYCFVPNGQTNTYSEMGSERKDKISHRALALQDLLHQLKV